MTTTLDEMIRSKLGDDGKLQDFADKCGVSVRSLCDLRRGLVKRPHKATLIVLAHEFGVTTEDVEMWVRRRSTRVKRP